MPHRLKEDYCTSDTVYLHPSVSLTFLLEGRRIFIARCHSDYLALKKAVIVTYRIASIGPCCEDVYECIMDGSDGSTVVIHLTEEDVYHNLRYVESQMEINHLAMVC